jgi:hypothetical protein
MESQALHQDDGLAAVEVDLYTQTSPHLNQVEQGVVVMEEHYLELQLRTEPQIQVVEAEVQLAQEVRVDQELLL